MASIEKEALQMAAVDYTVPVHHGLRVAFPLNVFRETYEARSILSNLGKSTRFGLLDECIVILQS